MKNKIKLEKLLSNFALKQVGGLAPGKSATATLPMMPFITVNGEKLTLNEVVIEQYCPCHVGPIVATNSRMERRNVYIYQIEDADVKVLNNSLEKVK